MKNLRTLLTIFFALSCFSQAISSQSLALADGNLEQSYKATGIAGELAPPDYGLRLDGFFDNKSYSEVIFEFNKVTLDLYDNGLLHMHGIVSIPFIDFKSDYKLDVVFYEITDESELKNIHHYNSEYRYYMRADVQENASMTNLEDGSDTTQLWSHPPSELKPFRIGIGANEFNDNLGAFGSLRYKHYFDDKITGTGYKNTGEFRMNLTPIGDPPEAVVEIISTELIAPTANIPFYEPSLNTNQEFQIITTVVNHSAIDISDLIVKLSSDFSSHFDSISIIEHFGSYDTVEIVFEVIASEETGNELFNSSIATENIIDKTKPENSRVSIRIQEPALIRLDYSLHNVVDGVTGTNTVFQLGIQLTNLGQAVVSNMQYKLSYGLSSQTPSTFTEILVENNANIHSFTTPSEEGNYQINFESLNIPIDLNTNELAEIAGSLNFDTSFAVVDTTTPREGRIFADANQANSNFIKLGEIKNLFNLELKNVANTSPQTIKVNSVTIRFFDDFGRPIFLGDFIDGNITGMYWKDELISTSRIDLNKLQLDFAENLLLESDMDVSLQFKAQFNEAPSETIEVTFKYHEIDAVYVDGPFVGTKPIISTKVGNSGGESFTFTFNDSDSGGEIIIKDNPVWHALGPVVISYDLQFVSSVDFRVYTLTGEEVYERRISAGSEGASAGENIIEWDGRNNSNDLVRSGVYIISIYSQASGDVMRTKVALIN